jgi:hypothetical protein
MVRAFGPHAGQVFPLHVTPLPLDDDDPLDDPLLLDDGPVSSGASSSGASSIASSVGAGSSPPASSSGAPLLLLALLLALLPLLLPLPELVVTLVTSPSPVTCSASPLPGPAVAQATIAPTTDDKKIPAAARPYQCILPVYMCSPLRQRVHRQSGTHMGRCAHAIAYAPSLGATQLQEALARPE